MQGSCRLQHARPRSMLNTATNSSRLQPVSPAPQPRGRPGLHCATACPLRCRRGQLWMALPPHPAALCRCRRSRPPVESKKMEYEQHSRGCTYRVKESAESYEPMSITTVSARSRSSSTLTLLAPLSSLPHHSQLHRGAAARRLHRPRQHVPLPPAAPAHTRRGRTAPRGGWQCPNPRPVYGRTC